MKKILIILIIATVVGTGCNTGSRTPASSDPPSEEPPESQSPGAQEAGPAPEFLAGLTKDEYDGLDFSVDVLERNAILPGMAFQATVALENKGDKTLFYTQGSGSFETPEALVLYSDTLQTVIPRDRLGIMTMDFVVQSLRPGDSLLFKLPVMAIEPSPDFGACTFELFGEEIYIADMEWSALQERYPDLAPAAPGAWTLKAYFRYGVNDGAGETDTLGGDTGYAEAECVVSVS